MSENMSKASIIVSYDGKALENHTMDIRELTCSLTGLADIFQEAHLVLNRGQATTSIQVKADSISKKDAEYFIFSEQENKINEYQTEMYLNLISPSFEDGNKWRFSTGSGKFFASIKDEKFLSHINSGAKLFGKKDIIKAKVLVKQNQTGDFQIKDEYYVLEVLEHKRNDQLGLFNT